MNYIIFAFRSRTQTMKFYEFCKREGIICSIINTPREASLGCGLSLKVVSENFAFARKILAGSGLETFQGTFMVTRTGNKFVVERI